MALSSSGLVLNPGCPQPGSPSLGRGGYGEVVRSQDQAIKLIKLTEGVIVDLIEIDILCRLHHPNLIHALGLTVPSKCQPDRLGINLPLMAYDLHKLQRGFKLSLNQKIDILQQIARGLSFLHANAIVHCDLKPANILLKPVIPWMFPSRGIDGPSSVSSSQFQVQISDFGSAVWIPAPWDHLNSSIVKFTLAYRPPETASIAGRRSYPLYCKGDTWSFGVIMVELIQGRTPFGARDDAGLVAEHTRFFQPGEKMVIIDLIERLSTSDLGQLIDEILVADPRRRPSWSIILGKLDATETSVSGFKTAIEPPIVRRTSQTDASIVKIIGDLIIRFPSAPVRLLFVTVDLFWRLTALMESRGRQMSLDIISSTAVFIALKLLHIFTVRQILEAVGDDLVVAKDVLELEESLLELSEGVLINPTPGDIARGLAQLRETKQWLYTFVFDGFSSKEETVVDVNIETYVLLTGAGTLPASS